jgi:hypothetical protein
MDSLPLVNDNLITNKNHTYLCYTILLLIIPICYFLFFIKDKPYIEYILIIFLIIIIILSQLFWSNPIKNSQIHKIDAIIAKIVIILFMVYTLIYKFKIGFMYFGHLFFLPDSWILLMVTSF